MPRKKPFDVCREFMCRRKTASGCLEAEDEKRFCRYHSPKQKAKNLKFANWLVPHQSLRTRCFVHPIKTSKKVCVVLLRTCATNVSTFDRSTLFRRRRCRTDGTMFAKVLLEGLQGELGNKDLTLRVGPISAARRTPQGVRLIVPRQARGVRVGDVLVLTKTRLPPEAQDRHLRAAILHRSQEGSLLKAPCLLTFRYVLWPIVYDDQLELRNASIVSLSRFKDEGDKRLKRLGELTKQDVLSVLPEYGMLIRRRRSSTTSGPTLRSLVEDETIGRGTRQGDGGERAFWRCVLDLKDARMKHVTS